MIEVFRQFQEWRATNQAKKNFQLWQTNHPIEARILELLDVETRHRPFLDNPRRRKLYEEAQQERRSYGFGDQLVPYFRLFPSESKESLAQDGVLLSERDLMLLQQVSYGYWARVGAFTKGVRHLKRFE